MANDALEQLFALFNATGKRDVERLCRTTTITSESLADLILAGRASDLQSYLYEYHFREISPETLEPTDEELAALATSKVGALQGKAQKAMRKMGQVFIDRRLLAVHLFYQRTHRHWHMFYFDQRDYSARKNHWKHGPHIHYTQHSLTNQPLVEVWSKVHASPPEFPSSLHVRYDYHHNRRRHGRA